MLVVVFIFIYVFYFFCWEGCGADVRNAVARSGNRVFLGLTSCRPFDRFWATQCRHCQKIGHTKDRCPAEDTSPACSFCAGPHTSLDCPDKCVLKCVNCSSLGSPAERLQ